MVIYLKHATHGTKVACDEAEASYDVSNGWTRYTPGETQAAPNPVPVAVEPDVRGAEGSEGDSAPVVDDGATNASEPEKKEPTIEELREAYKEKFGKAAHHKKSADTLRKELGL